MIERYPRPEMGSLWTLENRFRVRLEVELAVCEAWCELGVIPASDMEHIRVTADFDVDRILEIEERTRHDVIAVLTAVEETGGPPARFIHLGCTSSDIVDTANGVLLTRAGNLILRGLDCLLAQLRDMARRYKGLLTIGRTHGIHAEPTSFGLKLAGFYAEFFRHRERFASALEGVRVGKISGAVGGYAHLDPEVERLACERLGLAADPISTQIVQRDRHAAYFTALALLAGGVERLCLELRHLQRTEVREVEEGFGKGQKGSSAMPHKKNPISAENLTGLSRLVRSNSLAAMEDMALCLSATSPISAWNGSSCPIPPSLSITCWPGSPASSSAWWSMPTQCAATWTPPSDSFSPSACFWRSSKRAWTARRPMNWSRRPPCAAGTNRPRSPRPCARIRTSPRNSTTTPCATFSTRPTTCATRTPCSPGCSDWKNKRVGGGPRDVYGKAFKTCWGGDFIRVDAGEADSGWGLAARFRGMTRP